MVEELRALFPSRLVIHLLLETPSLATVRKHQTEQPAMFPDPKPKPEKQAREPVSDQMPLLSLTPCSYTEH